MSEPIRSNPDRTTRVVIITMALLAALGIGSVFAEPIAAVIFPPAPGGDLAPDERPTNERISRR